MKIKISFIAALSILVSGYSMAEIVPFDSDRWEFLSVPNAPMVHEVKEYLGEQSLYLKLGYAFLKDTEATDGILEYDVAFADPLEKSPDNNGFLGFVWHYQDLANYEAFYLRAQRSGEEKALQYEPLFNGLNNSIVYGDAFTEARTWRFNEWMHIKAVMSGDYVEIYVDDMETPMGGSAYELRTLPRSGKIGLKSGGAGIGLDIFEGAYYANFNFTPQDNPEIKFEPTEEIVEGSITSWLISELIEDTSLDGKLYLTEDDRNLEWTELATESSGLANFAIVQGTNKKEGKNTAFARTTIIADDETNSQLSFKYNTHNAVKAYLNGKLIFDLKIFEGDGDDTLGSFDYLFLPLQKGANELWMAFTSKAQGGWGVQANFTDLAGIELTTADSGIEFESQDSMDSCAASFADGKLHIPCLNFAGTMYEVDMSGNAPDYNFVLDNAAEK